MGKTERLGLDRINLRGGTQPRAKLDQATVRHYADLYEQERETKTAFMQPGMVFFDGSNYWLADGFHRWHARKWAGFDDLLVEVRQGTQRDAQLYSFGANAAHGVPRNPDDRERAVRSLLSDPDWAQKSDRWAAETCVVSGHYIAKMRKILEAETRSKASTNGTTDSSARARTEPSKRTGKDGRTQTAVHKPRPKPQKKDQQTPVDCYGVEIPKKCLPAFQDPWVQLSLDCLAEMTEQFYKLRLADNMAKRKKALPYFKVEDFVAGCGMVGDTLDKMVAHLKAGRFHAVCPDCKGAGCSLCSGHGWVNAALYEEIKESK